MASVTKERGFKTGGVSRCYQCGLQLQRVTGAFKFATVADRDGNKLRVHVHCVKLAVADGLKECK